MGLIEMKAKWLSYYKDIPHVALVTFVLNPKQNLEDFSTFLDAYHKLLGFNGGQNSQSWAMSEFETQWHALKSDIFADVNTIASNVRTQLLELNESYNSQYSYIVL